MTTLVGYGAIYRLGKRESKAAKESSYHRDYGSRGFMYDDMLLMCKG